ncbi:hypothetical protein N3K66_003210 [Trichothecium roseum]|uniref:Uncharacterized protein n=1 Tax=Trichothecium roseum TaxID=47278 RepID=A0ACC0V5B1_9HYPO|nr:hypothetical protein N3K66_003210 [Trichothecium roseum]
MSWNHSKPAHEPSTLIKLLPLLLTLAIVAVAAWVAHQIYLTSRSIGASASRRMGSKNVVLTRDGMRVGVRQVQNESYVDKTQGWVVKAWNLAKGDAEAEAEAEAAKAASTAQSRHKHKTF